MLKISYSAKYVLKKIILWKQILNQRTDRVECTSFLGLVSDPLMVSKVHNGIHGPEGQEKNLYNREGGGRRFIAARQSQSPAVEKSTTHTCRVVFFITFWPPQNFG